MIRTLTALSYFSLKIEALIGIGALVGALLIETHSKEGPYSKGGRLLEGGVTVC